MKDLLEQYLTERQATQGTLDQTVTARLSELSVAVRMLEEDGLHLETITTTQALRVVARVRAAGLSKNYTHRVIQSFKSFLLWYAENGGNLDEKKIRAIRSPGMDWRTKKAEDILTRDEVEQVMAACGNSRDRAIISMLYDGSFRPGEIVGMTWGDLIRDEHGIRLEYRTPKTGIERHIRLTYAVPYINAWEHDYTGTVSPIAPLFTQTIRHSRRYEPLTFGGLAAMFRRLKAGTGIKKLSPSILRPTKITHDVEAGIDLQYVMLKNWGSLKTPMIDIYARPGRDYVDRVALERAGVKLPETKSLPASLHPTICPECATLNPTGAKFCVTCGYDFIGSDVFREYDKRMRDPEMLRKFADYLERINPRD